MDDFGEFLTGLRGQIEHCAAEAGAEGGRRAAARVRSARRIAVLATLSLAAAAIALGVVFWPAGKPAAPAGGSRGTAAIVLTPTPRSPSSSSAQSPTLGLKASALREPGYMLLDVAAQSPNDIWAVGSLTTLDASGGQSADSEHSLVLHWDGSAWRQVRTPEVGAVRAIAVDAEGGAWAIAWGSEHRQHMLHWDGHTWTDTVLPAAAGFMSDIYVIAPDDVWAAGSKTDPMVTRGTYSWNPEHVRLIHWDGTAWTTVTAPVGARRGFLTSLSGTGPTDIWVVGRRDLPAGKAAGPLALHWDGTVWTRVSGIRGGAPWLVSVAALSPSDVWTGGENLLEHWDGHVWRRAPHDFSVYAQLSGLSPTSMWLATQNSGVVFWDGRDWQSFSLRDMGVKSADTRATINAVTAVSATDVWAVGEIWSRSQKSGNSWGSMMPLIVHWDGSQWHTVVDSVSSS